MKSYQSQILLLALVMISGSVFSQKPNKIIHANNASKVSARPNIILILIDDFGYENVTANGGESYKTPIMDQLAAKGVRFEECHVQPLCTPTRVELMTGMSNRRNYTNFKVYFHNSVTTKFFCEKIFLWDFVP